MVTIRSFWKSWIEPVLVAIVLAFGIRTMIFGLYHVPSGSAEPTLLVGDRLWGNKMAYFFSDVKRGDLVIFDNPEFPYAPEGSFKYYWQRYVGFPIALFGLPGGPDNVVKRVIAIPGDTIEGRIENGRPELYLNGKKLVEPYLNPFPLIKLRKTAGFVDSDLYPVPSFLGKKTLPDSFFSYDPTKAYSDQPYYNFEDEEVVVNPNTGKPFFRYPYTSTVKPNRFGVDDPEMFGSVDTFGPITLPKGLYWTMGDSRKNSYDSRFWGPLEYKFIHGRASFIIWSLDSSESFFLFDLIKHPIDFWTKHSRWNRCFTALGKYNGWNQDTNQN